MKALSFFVFFSMFSGLMGLKAQEELRDHFGLDSLYREDQLYLGFTYNLVLKVPEAIEPSGFSGGIQTGFIRDFPINTRRNLSFGAGLGWSFNNYGHNLFIGEDDAGKTIFRAMDEEEVSYDKNRMSTQAIDLPLQFRWRTSTAQSHKFWRVYAGFNIGYVYYFRSHFRQEGNTVIQTKVPEFNRLQTGATFSFGYNTFNFHFYYSLNPFFDKTAIIDGNPINMGTLRMGLRFYML